MHHHHHREPVAVHLSKTATVSNLNRITLNNRIDPYKIEEQLLVKDRPQWQLAENNINKKNEKLLT